MKIKKLFLTWFGCGLVPKAPGTMGTLGTLPLAWALIYSIPQWEVRLGLISVFTLFSVWLCVDHQKTIQTHDPQYIVIDESVGILWSMAFLPVQWELVVLAFIIFRLLDVLKPFPASYFDRLSEKGKTSFSQGAGIVLDDWVAGLYTAWILYFIQRQFF